MDTPAPPPAADAPSPVPSPATAAMPRRRGRRWPAAAALALLVLLAGTAALLGWLWTAEPPLAWLLARVPGLSVQGFAGTLRQGDFSLRALDWHLPGGSRLRITDLRVEGLHWQAPYAMSARLASAREVRYDSAPASPGPATPPADLRLPVSVDIARVLAQAVHIDHQPPLRDLQASLTLGADQGTRHRVVVQALQWESMQLAGRAEIGSGGGLPVALQLQARATGGMPWTARLDAHGPLQRLQVEATLAGEPPAAGGDAPSLEARATVLPFAVWPLDTLQLATRQLDLAALSPRLPGTSIDGRADIRSRGLDQPAQAQVALRNARPGRHDEGRLPLREIELALEAEPRRARHLQLQRFELRLADADGDAGSITGSGRWADGQLRLQLQLDGVLPARLDARAAPLLLGGPLTLEVSGLTTPGTPSGPAAPPATPPASGPPGPTGTPGPAAAGASSWALAAQGRLAGRSLDGSGLPVRVQFDLAGTAGRWTLREAAAQAGTARAQLQGEARQDAAGWRISADARLAEFDPLPWWRGKERSAWRRGPHRLNAELAARLQWRDAPPPGRAATTWPAALSGEVDATLGASQFAGVPLSGQVHANLTERGASTSGRVDLAGNRLEWQAELAPDGLPQRWRIDAQAPALARLAPLLAVVAELAPGAAGWLPTAGELQVQAEGEGRWPALHSRGQLHARGLRSRDAGVADADLRWQREDAADARLLLDLSARGVQHAQQSIDRLALHIDGTESAHRLTASAESPLRPPAWSETLLGPTGTGTQFSAEGQASWQRSAAGPRWHVTGLRLQGRARGGSGGTPWLVASELDGRAEFTPAGALQAAQLSPGRVQLLNTGLRWRAAEWRAGSAGADSRFALAAELESFDVAALLRQLQPGFGWSGNLSVGGRIDLRHSGRFDADIVLERLGGDLGVTDELGQTQVLGLTDLRLAFSAHDGVWQFAQGLAGRQLGEMAGAQVIRTGAERAWPAADAPLQGVLQMRVANLGIWSPWVPPGWRLGGSLVTSASIDGRFNAPELRGEMRGSGLAVRHLLQGINVSDGELAITLQGERARIERFVFRGGDGTLALTGGATLGEQPGAQLTLTAERFRALGRVDRRLVTSGRAELALERGSLRLDGRFAIDEGLIDVSRAEAPRLDDDVHIAVPARAGGASAPGSTPRAGSNGARAAAAREPSAASPLRDARVDVAVDLGSQLRLRGRGIDTGVRGQLRVSSPGNQLALTGSVRTEGGTYAAYGQKLEIARGVLVFGGDAANPRLDVLAVRPNLDVTVGVAVTGTAQNPRIRLTSEPDMPEIDKLSWLVLGRSPDGLGRTDTALLQRAAIALLAGEGGAPTDDLISRLGLTDFSVRQSEGDVRETIVSLGRQLSRRWYVGYERSVNATSGTWQLIYRAAQRFTLRAQSGGENSVDLIWSWRW